MKRPCLPLLSRLRRHRGLWVWAVAVLLFKVVTSSICFADPPTSSPAADANASAQLATAKIAVPDDAGCLLGEAGGCHCTCAHNMPVPAGIAWVVLSQSVSFTPAAISAGMVPEPVGSLLRPPIVA
jgi:hypothetical protein